MKRVLFLVSAIAICLSACTSQALKPEEVIPTNVSGFKVLKVEERAEPTWEPAEYSSRVLLVPKGGSKYEGKVSVMVIEVTKFEDKKSAGRIAEEVLYLIKGLGRTSEINIDGLRATLSYEEDIGRAMVISQYNNLLITCGAGAPLKATSFDRQALEDAAITGVRATAKKL